MPERLECELLQKARYINTLTYLLYAASAWWGFTTATDRQRLEALIKRGIRSGLCGADVSTLTEMVDSADYALFKLILYNPNHVLHSLLHDLNATGHYFRHRRHDRVLPPQTGSLQISNFLIRQLYEDSH